MHNCAGPFGGGWQSLLHVFPMTFSCVFAKCTRNMLEAHPLFGGKPPHQLLLGKAEFGHNVGDILVLPAEHDGLVLVVTILTVLDYVLLQLLQSGTD